ncbi:SDR family oxidoreductase [Rhizobium leguminosarum]|uniref:SDR family oxidoreductase n=1 Tax=Rhizobium leguminosarum TaxID=384 RepID=UPI001C928CB6|nr:SDR family oxidoreductase [Rhizobium leguminosarum]MBY3043348.1 SDR family oxidoreductase [Rhizobium leguminosarum]
MTSLTGKTIIIFGGSSGIGLGVAAATLERGANVVIAGRSEEKLQAAEEELGGPPHLRSFAADLEREADLTRLFETVGEFDHLVTTAGTPPPGAPIEALDLDVIRRFVDNKLIGTIALAKHASPYLKRGGSMTITSGINKDRPPVPGGAVVAAIAGSFSYFAHGLALELAPSRVNVVSPGWVDTPMWDVLVGSAKSGYLKYMAGRLPAGRIATLADVASAYIYLMESDFTTGETIHVDGGQRLI